MEETRAGLAKYCFRQLPSASADVQHMCGRKTEDGNWEIMRKTDQKWSKWQKQGQGWQNIASVSFRGRPTHVWTEDGNWKIMRKNRPKMV